MRTIADQIRNVVDDRDFRVDDGMSAASAADGQAADGELVAGVDRLPAAAELGRGLDQKSVV